MSTALALSFAEAAHRGQVRKYSGEPYIRHPERVADILRTYGYYERDDLICAAYLHDVIEDCRIPGAVIEATFGDVVADLVVQLTNQADYGTVSADAKLVKCADIIDNASTVLLHAGPDYARKYLREKWEQIATMYPGGTAEQLPAAAFKLVQGEIAKIGVE